MNRCQYCHRLKIICIRLYIRGRHSGWKRNTYSNSFKMYKIQIIIAEIRNCIINKTAIQYKKEYHIFTMVQVYLPG